MQSPTLVKVSSGDEDERIEQVFYQISDPEREEAVVQLLLARQPNNAILFCNTKRTANELHNILKSEGFSVRALQW